MSRNIHKVQFRSNQQHNGNQIIYWQKNGIKHLTYNPCLHAPIKQETFVSYLQQLQMQQPKPRLHKVLASPNVSVVTFTKINVSRYTESD